MKEFGVLFRDGATGHVDGGFRVMSAALAHLNAQREEKGREGVVVTRDSLRPQWRTIGSGRTAQRYAEEVWGGKRFA